MNDSVAHPLALTLTIFLTVVATYTHTLSLSLSFSVSLRFPRFLPLAPFPFFSLTVALLLCTWWSKSGNSSTRAFCQTDYGTSAVSLAPLHPIMRPASSLVPFSLCLLVSVLIRHFADIYTVSTMRYYVGT